MENGINSLENVFRTPQMSFSSPDQYCGTCNSLSGCICDILGTDFAAITTACPSTSRSHPQLLQSDLAQTPAYPVPHLFTPPPNRSSYLPPAGFPLPFNPQFYAPPEAPQLAQYGYNGILPPEDTYMYAHNSWSLNCP